MHYVKRWNTKLENTPFSDVETHKLSEAICMYIK